MGEHDVAEPLRALALVADQRGREGLRLPQRALDGLAGQALAQAPADCRRLGAAKVVTVGIGWGIGGQKVKLQEIGHGVASSVSVSGARVRQYS